MGTIKCGKCGKSNDPEKERWWFCQACGSELSRAEVAAPQITPPESNQTGSVSPHPYSIGRSPWEGITKEQAGAFVIVAALLIFVGVVLSTSDSRESPKSAPKPPPFDGRIDGLTSTEWLRLRMLKDDVQKLREEEKRLLFADLQSSIHQPKKPPSPKEPTVFGSDTSPSNPKLESVRAKIRRAETEISEIEATAAKNRK